MKFINGFLTTVFSDRFSFFDFAAIIVIVELSKAYSWWWMIAIVPLSIIGAAVSIRYDKQNSNPGIPTR
jgi:hypothetical protein